MSVTEHDFGKASRDTRRLLCRLLGLLEAQEEELRTDPVRLFGLSVEEISRLHRILRDANEALVPVLQWKHDDIPVRPDFNTMNVPLDEYRRLKACAAIVQNWRPADTGGH